MGTYTMAVEFIFRFIQNGYDTTTERAQDNVKTHSTGVLHGCNTVYVYIIEHGDTSREKNKS